jgi:hypothetical protein
MANARRRIRPLLKSLVSLRLEGASGDPVTAALREPEGCYREDSLYLYDWESAPEGHPWKPLIQEDDRTQPRPPIDLRGTRLHRRRGRPSRPLKLRRMLPPAIR